MNLHRVSTHVSPIASEIARRPRGSSRPLEIASSPRAPDCRIELEAHSLVTSKVVAQVFVKVLS